MPKIDLIRVWKDSEYRNSLDPAQLAGLPANPAGPTELREQDLELAAGGATWGPSCVTGVPSCDTWTDNGSTCEPSC